MNLQLDCLYTMKKNNIDPEKKITHFEMRFPELYYMFKLLYHGRYMFFGDFWDYQLFECIREKHIKMIEWVLTKKNFTTWDIYDQNAKGCSECGNEKFNAYYIEGLCRNDKKNLVDIDIPISYITIHLDLDNSKVTLSYHDA